MNLTRLSWTAKAFTLVEVMIATIILLLFAVGLISSITFASRSVRVNGNAIAAKNIAQGFFERMAIDEFANVGPVNYPTINYNSDPPVWLDQALNIRCKVEYQFKGFGTIANSSANSLTHDNVSWEPDEWAGDTVFIVSGVGAGQSATIDSNGPDTLVLSGNLDILPRAGDKYMINNGKTVEITTTWLYRAKEYRQTIESLVINYRNSPNLGF